ncbi:MAG: HNH endonuclease [Sphingomonadaceae bacterium]|jgi:hypothetical protein|uniref:HNH endonuclease signature motif containing protein n=1 Tax=Sphingorhabdus sp. TaxID=1902408 RepID=UPI0039BD851E|nr:HNH endonuclease [Sphingomonadaceae bacterium]
MDYKRIYDQFIADRRTKEKALRASGKYFERHHITPRSMGGTNDAGNMIALTAGDHYFAHECLARILGGGMWGALYFMSHINSKSAKGFFARRWQYETARENYAKNLPEHIVHVGSRLADNAKRLAALSDYFSNTDHGAAVKARYENTEYYERWRQAQKDAWTPDRRKATGEKTRSLWATDEYRNKMRNRKSPWSGRGGELAEIMKDRWVDHTFRTKMLCRKYSVATQFKGVKVINVDTGEIFDSSLKAAEKYEVSGAAIRAAIKHSRKSAGFRWAHAS